MDEQSVKDYMVADLNVTDANNFEPNANLYLECIFYTNLPTRLFLIPQPKMVSAITLQYFRLILRVIQVPQSQDFLKVGDTKKPTLTMMGKSVIHDFLRFKSNAVSEDNNFHFLIGHDPSTNPI